MLSQSFRPARVLGKLSAAAVCLSSALALVTAAQAADLRSTPFFDGERRNTSGGVINNWGGGFGTGSTSSLTLQNSVKRSGNGAYKIDLTSVPSGQTRFFQTYATELKSIDRRNTRDLTYFDRFETYVRNDTGAPLNFTIELKDYRDSSAHQATKSFAVPVGGWTKVETSLNPTSGWTVAGSPQFDRTYAMSFLVTPQGGTASGSLYLDDARFVEPGAPLDPATAPFQDIAETLARRTFNGLWGSRSRASGLIPNVSTDADTGALNTTSGVLWALPSAVRRGWVTQAEADAYVGQLATTLNTNMDQTLYLPSRFLDLTTGSAGSNWEASPIDASFVALGLHQYKNQPGLDPALAAQLDQTVNRFNFAALRVPNGWRLNYTPSGGFTAGVYDGYTTEGKVISLAAELSDAHHVDLAVAWNTDTYRTLAFLADPSNASVNYGDTNYRAPFSQALVNLFVDLSDRGKDNYPNPALRVNPWQNFINYEADTAAKLDQLGRDNFFQPDAGQGGGTTGYQAYSLYNLHGAGSVTNADLFMPWSAALAALSGSPQAEGALRFLLENDFHGPLGLPDSARWTTGAPGPSSITAFQDNWNLALSLMALMREIDGPEGGARFLADLPQLAAALDAVFTDRLPGDYRQDLAINQRDYDAWKLGFGGGDLSADGNGDRVIDAADYTVWRDSLAGAPAEAATGGVPEPAGLFVLAVAVLAAGAFRRSSSSRKELG